MKGGDPTYRARMVEIGFHHGAFGREKAVSRMTEATRKDWGWGPYADEPFTFNTIERTVTAIAWFYDQLVFDMEDEMVNPARSVKTKRTVRTIEKLLGRGRVYESPELLREHVLSMLGKVCAGGWEGGGRRRPARSRVMCVGACSGRSRR